MLERFEENPFLEKFYENPEAHAFSVELSFLADRYKQMQGALKAVTCSNSGWWRITALPRV